MSSIVTFRPSKLQILDDYDRGFLVCTGGLVNNLTCISYPWFITGPRITSLTNFAVSNRNSSDFVMKNTPNSDIVCGATRDTVPAQFGCYYSLNSTSFLLTHLLSLFPSKS